jgi:uncharacterized Fe-S center protein
MKSEVYFTRMGADHGDDSILKRLTKLFDRAGGGGIIKENDIVAVKAHFGEQGNVSFVSPVYYRTIVDRIKVCGGSPFITDANTLYVGERNNAVKHLNVALRHGFSYATVNAPVIIADGLLGADFVEVNIDKKHIKKAKVAAAIYWAPVMIVMTHCKGHMLASFGGALKNVGMGCASRAGKQEQHSGNVPKFDSGKCIGCGSCLDWCNFGALKVVDGKVINDPVKCAGCGECIAACRFDAIESNWDADAEAMQEKMVEYCCAALENKKGKVLYFNFVLNVTPECDCMPSSDRFMIPDIGILASFDPVAIDTASLDMINKAKTISENVRDKKDFDLKYSDTDKMKMAHPNIDWHVQLKYAEELGLGSKDYDLIEI